MFDSICVKEGGTSGKLVVDHIFTQSWLNYKVPQTIHSLFANSATLLLYIRSNNADVLEKSLAGFWCWKLVTKMGCKVNHQSCRISTRFLHELFHTMWSAISSSSIMHSLHEKQCWPVWYCIGALPGTTTKASLVRENTYRKNAVQIYT